MTVLGVWSCLSRPCSRVPAAEGAFPFAIVVTLYPACGGGQRLVTVLTDPDTICTYLTGVGLAAEPSAIAAARPSPQRALELVV